MLYWSADVCPSDLICDSPAELRRNRKLSHHVPDTSDIVTFDVTPHAVFDIGIEWIAVIGPLPPAVRAVDQRHAPILLCIAVGRHWRPMLCAGVVAIRLSWLITVERIHRPAARRGHHRPDRGVGHIATAVLPILRRSAEPRVGKECVSTGRS